ncbi:MAG: valine--tRNA ligase [Bacilli bacterium]
MEKRYNPHQVEQGKYDFWLKHELFKAGDPSKPPFSMVIPPPNVTGKLHLGHAINSTIQDIIARYKKARGYDVLWLPGTDHAGIATQARVIGRLKDQGIDYHQLGREGFLAAAWSWKEEYASAIREQWARLGVAVDYSRECFTLDENFNDAVNEVFIQLYNEGLIYQGEKIINWDPELQTALSNIEVIYQEVEGEFYYFRYPVVGTDEYLVVATTRPETMFADVALVVHPEDQRFKKYVGKQAINPANLKPLPIIADAYVDLKFGTGVMKCTPAHDPNDFVLGQKYGLPHPICLNPDGTINQLGGELNGLDRFVGRKKLVAKIKGQGHFEKIEKIIHAVGHSERSNAVIEPYLSKQWFIKMRPLAEKVIANQKGKMKVAFLPPRFENTLIQWMENAEDWCISRQLWWGHRLPVYYHRETGAILVSKTPPRDSDHYRQDEDVLDTWFSSALWPFATLGWPKKTPDLARYYPNSVMVTAYDIIFFWVARMIFQGLHFTKTRPFEKVVITGIIRDELGRKMSKSLGNGIDPMEVIDKYGADALRYFLTTNSTPGQDMRYSDEKVGAANNYLNKIWNSARYVFMNLPENFAIKPLKTLRLAPVDQWILGRLQQTRQAMEDNLDAYEFGIASTYLYNFVYDDFCSSYLEFSKVSLNSQIQEEVEATRQVLLFTLKNIILMINPFTPFIAEEIYQFIPGHKRSIADEPWPQAESYQVNLMEQQHVEILLAMIKDLRSFRVDQGLAPNAPVTMALTPADFPIGKLFPYLKRLAFVKDYQIVNELSPTLPAFHYEGFSISVAVEIDRKALKEKLLSEIARLQKEVKRSEKILNSPGFLNKAPGEKIAEEKQKYARYLEELAEFTKQLAAL